MLEGGQTKEDAKRNEIFWNETLAPDQIDRLLDPKVLTRFKKFDSDGVHRVTELSKKDNLIVKGNNLLALHSLKKIYAGKVKLIYIDPPYNTGNDSFGYNDRFNHSTWLTFMKNRFVVADKLLHNNGFLVVQCDDNEQAYLKVLMDEILDMTHLTTICVQMSYVSGEKMAHIDKKPPKIKEFLHIFSKHHGAKITPQYTTSEVNYEYNKYVKKNDSDDENDWEVVHLNQVLKKNNIKGKQQKDEFMLNNASNIFNRVRNKSKVYKETRGNKKLQKIITATGLEKWAWNGREAVFLSDRVIEDHKGKLKYVQALGDIWDDIPIVNLYLEGGVKLLKGKKPEFLLYRLIDMFTNENDIILDYHLGSGTTAAVAHKMGRQFIGIEQLDYGENDSVIRLNNVLNGDETGISARVDWQGGGSFTYAELMKYNAQYVEQIEEANSSKELHHIWNSMQENAFLSYKVEPNVVNKEKESFEQLTLEEQKQFLIEVLDKNQLYVNYSEIDDEEFNVSEEDKELNHQFYALNKRI